MHINYNPHFLQKNFLCFNVINPDLVVGSLTPINYNMTKIIHSNLFLSVILQIIAQFSLKVEIGSVVPERIKLKM